MTGASSGIGEEIANLYCKHGANLVITARREERLRQACTIFNFAFLEDKISSKFAAISRKIYWIDVLETNDLVLPNRNPSKSRQNPTKASKALYAILL